ncbi:MAG: bleomycin resistance protein [Alphaproteobacteria bacterium]
MSAESGTARLDGFSAVFTVADVGAAIAYYRDRLGFRVQFAMGDPPAYAIVERDRVSLHLMPAAQEARALGLSSIYVYVRDADALHRALLARGCPIEAGPEDFAYGMRELSLRDPDGNRITFGQDISARAQTT